jgi:hypothetical protein
LPQRSYKFTKLVFETVKFYSKNNLETNSPHKISFQKEKWDLYEIINHSGRKYFGIVVGAAVRGTDISLV